MRRGRVLIPQGFAVQRPPLHVPGGRTVGGTARLSSTLCTCRFGSPLRLSCWGTASAPVSRHSMSRPWGYPQHPFGTVHAKIIFLMKANGVLDFDINELGCISRDLGMLLWTAKSSPPVFRDAAGRLASPKRYGALTGSPPETAATARVPAFEHGTGTYACAVDHGTATYACAVP